MTNSEIIKKLEQQFGTYQIMIFCKMNAHLHKLCYEDTLKEGIEDYHDHGYDADWWQNEYNKLHTKYTEDHQ